MDISSYLQSWEYEPGKLLVRQFTGEDGLEKIQLRVDLGILQMNRDGRPDGTTPYGRESVFDYVRDQIEGGEVDPGDFQLTENQLMELQQEALQYYHRYICFYELGEYQLVIRDAGRNLDLYEFMEEFAPEQADVTNLWGLKPQLLMMFAHSEAMILMQNGKKGEAIDVLEDAIEEIDEFYEDCDGAINEPTGEKTVLRKLIKDIRQSRPMSPRDSLKLQMAIAVQKEEYERAAEIRDQLRDLESSPENTES
jgi:tetratricopeptide (TPR) repeat protein